jgi:hypothetical protein
MPERTIEQIRSEIELERRLLVDDVAALREDIKRVLPLAIGAAFALAVLTRSKNAQRAIKVLWWLR